MNKQIRVGAILQYVQMFLSIFISLVYTPMMLKMLGQSEYGLYNLASSIISYLSLLSLGFGASYVRFYTLYKKNNPSKISNLNGLYFAVFLIIGFVALVVGTFISFNVSIFFNNTYSHADISIAKALMIVLTINLAISFPMSLFSSYVISQEKFIFQKIINIGKTVLSPAISIVALFFGYGSIGLVVITTIVSIVVDIINIYYCFKKLKFKIALRKVEWCVFKDIAVFSVFIAINQIIDQINWQTDKIILGKMMTSAAVSIYAIGAVFNTYFIQFSTAISSLFVPKINRIVIENKPNKNAELTKIMTSVGRIQFMILSLILLGFVFFGKRFIQIWAGQEYTESYYVALVLMIPELFPLIQNIGIEIQRAENKHQFRSIVYLIMALVNVAITILLVAHYGIIGAAIGTSISIVLANILIMNIYYHFCLKINILYFWKGIVLILPSLIVPSLIGYFLSIESVNSFAGLLKAIFVFVSFYVLFVFAFGLNRNERNAVKKILKV